MLQNLKELDSNMSLKVHFLNSHLEYFAENLCAFREEQSERFHQAIKSMKI